MKDFLVELVICAALVVVVILAVDLLVPTGRAQELLRAVLVEAARLGAGVSVGIVLHDTARPHR